MTVKGQDNGGAADGGRLTHCMTDQCLMPQMESVKGPCGKNYRTGKPRKAFNRTENGHRRKKKGQIEV